MDDGVLACEPGFVAGPGNRRPGAPVLFLDRDGVINVNHGYVHTIEQTEWVDGIFEFVSAAQRHGHDVLIATNQAGIARGYYDTDTFRAYTLWVHESLLARGIAVVGTYWCPHHPVAGNGVWTRPCSCRKPAPGMLLAARNAFAIDMGQCTMVGDSPSDISAACSAGIGNRILLDALNQRPNSSGETLRCRTLEEAGKHLGWM